ncbi:hypothetical protein [Brevundimonas sp.]|uniref:hypothetical protein n=1 Tax=Brevundimonas sp. TaxID=1871086 RepID=UPI002D5F74CD|nr:hypothetical protein [Brevundimonas sp.]HYC98493.1 hypothetical protein [Brevundimonas sp.]
MSFSLGGGKNKSKSSEQSKFSQTNTLSNRAAGLLGGGISDLRGKSYKDFDPASLGKFQDPYAADVRDATLAQMDHADSVAFTKLKDQIAGSGGFNNSRRGVMEAELAGQQARDRASMIAGMNQQGWQQALEAALGENQNRNTYDLGTQDLITRLLSEFGREGTSSGTSSGTSKSSGTNLGFSFSPFAPQK